MLVVHFFFFLTIVTSVESFRGCQDPLGIEDGRIKDDQISASSAYKNDSDTYGAHQARLNKHTWPPGYRSNPTDNGRTWIRVDLPKPFVITSIATQGYGDDNASEWLEGFYLFYSHNATKGYKSTVRTVRNKLFFHGNDDKHKVKLNYLPFPVIAQTVLIIQHNTKKIHRNVGLRMELYGCEPGHKFVSRIMIRKKEFRLQYMYPYTDKYQTLEEEVLYKVSKQLDHVPGFLSVNLTHFSPQPLNFIQYVAAELEIYCLASKQEEILAELEKLKKMDDFFESSYLSVSYPSKKDCLPPLIDSGLAKNKWPELARQVLRGFSATFKFTNQSRCNYGERTSVFGCSATGIDSGKGLFRYYLPASINNGTFKFFRTFFTGSRLKLAYVTCFARLIVNRTFLGETHDYGFVQLSRSRIIAKIDGKNTVIKGTKYAHFNARNSYDTIQRWNLYHGLTFSWKCESNGEDVPVLDNSSKEYPMLKITTPFVNVKIDVAKLKAGVNYTLTLFVSRGRKNALVRKLVVVYDEAFFNLSCRDNCGVRSNQPRSFKITCTGTTCSHIATYKWKLLYQETPANDVCTGEIIIKNNATLLKLSDLTCPGIGILNVTCIAVFNDLLEHSQMATSTSLLLANTTRSCKVTPPSGRVLQTEYKVKCFGWTDGGLSVRYRFALSTDSRSVLLSESEVSNITTTLPVGNFMDDFRVNLSVRITYDYGEVHDFVLFTKVELVGMTELLDILEHGSNGRPSFVDLLNNGDVNTAASIAIGALSVLKNIPQVKENRYLESKVKSTVVHGFQNVTVRQTIEVHKLLYIIALLSQSFEQQDPKSQDNQAAVLRILNRTMTFLSKRIHSSPEALPLIQECFFGIGFIVKTASTDAKGKQGVTERHSKARQIVNTGLHLIKQMNRDLTASLKPGITSINLTSPFVNILVSRQSAKDLRGATVKFRGAMLSLPSQPIKFVDGYRVRSTDLLDLKVQLWTENPYSWHETSDIINSTVLDIKIEVSRQEKSHGNLQNCNNESNSTCNPPLNSEPSNATQPETQKITTTTEMTNLTSPIELYIPILPQLQSARENSSKDDNYPVVNFIKLSKDKEKHFMYHEVDVPTQDSTARVTLKPGLNVEFNVYVQHSFKPTLRNYTFNKTIPDFSPCSYSLESGTYSNCSSDPFSFSFSWKDTGYLGLHYIGILYYGEEANRTLEHTTSHSRSTKRKTAIVKVKRSVNPCEKGRRNKRSCVEYKDPPSPGPSFELRQVRQVKFSDVNYTIRLSSGACMFWSEEHQRWKTDGCRLGSESTKQLLHCVCDHLTAFGGDFFVAPNPIQYDKVWDAFKNLNESGNIGVLATVCILLALYLLGLIALRHFDKKDKEKVINRTIELQSSDSTPYKYKVQLETGIWKNSGTTAEVGMIIYGENRSSGPICLTDSECNKPFARASINTFNIHVDETFGSLIKIRVWHSNRGDDPDWYLHQVIITDSETKQKWHFFVNRWLAVNRDDGSLSYEAKTFNDSDVSKFRDFFIIRTARGFANDHLWISIFTRPPHSPFTRCQRFACCMSILFTAMIANAMFYGVGALSKDDSFYIGPLKLSFNAIKIGIQSAMIAIPVNVIIVMIFKKGQSKTNEDAETSGASRFQKILVYLGWFICNATILSSAVYVVFYSMQWGKEISNNWLISVIVSSVQDIFVTGPIKVIVLACILSSILKSPPKEDKITNTSKPSVIKGNNRFVEQPEETELEKAKIYNEQKAQLYKTIRTLVRLTVLFLLFATTCYGNRDSSRFMLTKSVNEVFRNFEKVHHPIKFWEWTSKVLIPGLYNTTWYNSQEFSYAEGFISNHESFLIGVPRLRQIRIKPIDQCIASDIVTCIKHMFRRCLALFSSKYEDRGPYYLPQWRHVNQNLSKTELGIFCPKAWRFESNVEHFGPSDSKGSYIAELGYNSQYAFTAVDDLEKNHWIDDRTVAVYVEFTIFEPASSLLCIVRYTYEKLLLGEANAHTLVKTLSLYPPSNARLRVFLFVCKLALLVYVFALFILELRKAFLKKCDYFRKLWSWFDIFLLLLCIGSLVLTSFVEHYASRFVQKIRDNPYKNWSTESLVFHSDAEIAFLGFVLFILTIRMIKIVSYNRPVLVMLLSLKSAAVPLSSFGIIFVLAVTAFSILANITFGASVYVYSSLPRAFLEVLQLGSFGGKIDFQELYQLSPIIGPMYMFLLRIIMTFILINFFIAILNLSFAVSNAERNVAFENMVLKEFAMQQFKRVDVWKTCKHYVVAAIALLSNVLPQLKYRSETKKHLMHGRNVSECEESTEIPSNLVEKALFEKPLQSTSFPVEVPNDNNTDSVASWKEPGRPLSTSEIPLRRQDELNAISNESLQTIDDFDDIEFIDEDDLMATIKKSLSEISLSLAESLKDSRSQNQPPDYQAQSSEVGRSPSESLLYSGSSPSYGFSRSNRSIDLQSLDDASECSFNSGYYRIGEDYSHR